MTLALTPDMLAAAYEYLRTTPPFRGWKLPEADEIELCVMRSREWFGRYSSWRRLRGRRRHYRIEISSAKHAHTATLFQSMAHEMVHLYQELAKTDTPNVEHNAEFYRLAKRVARHHGFDPKGF